MKAEPVSGPQRLSTKPDNYQAVQSSIRNIPRSEKHQLEREVGEDREPRRKWTNHNEVRLSVRG